jgi:hypothetical protein
VQSQIPIDSRFIFFAWSLLALMLLASISKASPENSGTESSDSLLYWFEETERLWAARDFVQCKEAANRFLQSTGAGSEPEKEIRLMIEDDGDEFNPDALLKSKEFGWKNIQSRVNIMIRFLDVDCQEKKRDPTYRYYTPIFSESTKYVPFPKH